MDPGGGSGGGGFLLDTLTALEKIVLLFCASGQNSMEYCGLRMVIVIS